MWIKLGSSPADSTLPPRFERMYHPAELSHFDKFFARPWSQPSRLSHEDSHTSVDSDVDGIGMTPRKSPTKDSKASLFNERAQSYKARDNNAASDEVGERNQSLDEFINIHGFNSKNRTTLNQLLKAHNQQPHGIQTVEPSDKQCK